MSYALALRTKSEASLSAIFNVALLPLLLLSGIMLPLSFAPRWIGAVARFNPLWYLVSGTRDQFERGDLTGSAVIAWAIAFGGMVVAYLWGSHEFGKRR